MDVTISGTSRGVLAFVLRLFVSLYFIVAGSSPYLLLLRAAARRLYYTTPKPTTARRRASCSASTRSPSRRSPSSTRRSTAARPSGDGRRRPLLAQAARPLQLQPQGRLHVRDLAQQWISLRLDFMSAAIAAATVLATLPRPSTVTSDRSARSVAGLRPLHHLRARPVRLPQVRHAMTLDMQKGMAGVERVFEYVDGTPEASPRRLPAARRRVAVRRCASSPTRCACATGRSCRSRCARCDVHASSRAPRSASSAAPAPARRPSSRRSGGSSSPPRRGRRAGGRDLDRRRRHLDGRPADLARSPRDHSTGPGVLQRARALQSRPVWGVQRRRDPRVVDGARSSPSDAKRRGLERRSARRVART